MKLSYAWLKWPGARPSVVETLETSIWVPRSSHRLARAGQFIDERLHQRLYPAPRNAAAKQSAKSWTCSVVASGPIRPMRKIFPASGPKPPAISMPCSLSSVVRTLASSTPCGTFGVFKFQMRCSGATSISHGSLCSTRYCLAQTPATGAEYLVYAPAGGSFTADLSAMPASRRLALEWFNPSTGATIAGDPVPAGSSSQSFTPPFSGDAVLYLVDAQRR